MTYAVSRINRDELRYTEDSRTVIAEVESGFDRPIEGPIGEQHLEFVNLVVYISALRQWDNGDGITDEDRERIGRNIGEALTASGTKHILA